MPKILPALRSISRNAIVSTRPSFNAFLEAKAKKGTLISIKEAPRARERTINSKKVVAFITSNHTKALNNPATANKLFLLILSVKNPMKRGNKVLIKNLADTVHPIEE